jgi:hypothetical protein
MLELLARVVEAHERIGALEAACNAQRHYLYGGALQALKVLVQDVNPRTVSMRMHTEYVRHANCEARVVLRLHTRAGRD